MTSPTTQPPPSVTVTVGMALAGIAAVLLSVLMILPVAVNLPDSWFGAVLALAFAVGGCMLIYRAARRMSARPQ